MLQLGLRGTSSFSLWMGTYQIFLAFCSFLICNRYHSAQGRYLAYSTRQFWQFFMTLSQIAHCPFFSWSFSSIDSHCILFNWSFDANCVFWSVQRCQLVCGKVQIAAMKISSQVGFITRYFLSVWGKQFRKNGYVLDKSFPQYPDPGDLWGEPKGFLLSFLEKKAFFWADGYYKGWIRLRRNPRIPGSFL